jgi:hypothetical protein
VVAAVDCDKDANKGLCSRYGVQGFPTLKLFGAEKQKTKGGGTTKSPSDYNGPRTAKAMADAVTAMLHDLRISKLAKPAAAEAWEAKHAASPRALLFSDKVEASGLYKALSMQLSPAGLAFAQVHTSASALLSRYGVSSTPALLVLPAGAGPEAAVKYDGDMKAAPLLAFLRRHAPGGAGGSADADAGDKPASGGKKEKAGKAGKKGEKAAPAVEPAPRVGPAGLEALDAAEEWHLAAFVASPPGGCATQLAALDAVASELRSLINTTVVDVNAAAGGGSCGGAGDEKAAPAAAADEGMCTAPPPAAAKADDGVAEKLAAYPIDVPALRKAPCSLQVRAAPCRPFSLAAAPCARSSSRCLYPSCAARSHAAAPSSSAKTKSSAAAATPREQLVLLPFGADKGELEGYVRYEGPLDAKSLQTWVMAAAPDLTTALAPEAIESWLSSSLAAGAGGGGGAGGSAGGAPRVLLVTNKNEAPPVFRALAARFRAASGLAFGWVQHADPSKPVFRDVKARAVRGRSQGEQKRGWRGVGERGMARSLLRRRRALTAPLSATTTIAIMRRSTQCHPS